MHFQVAQEQTSLKSTMELFQLLYHDAHTTRHTNIKEPYCLLGDELWYVMRSLATDTPAGQARQIAELMLL